MNSIKAALLTSTLSRGWIAVINLIAVPLYIRILGIESYGIVGFFTSFSVIIGFLDLGLGATLGRELSQTTSQPGTLANSRNLARTFEHIYFVLALLIGIGATALAVPLAHHWIRVESLEPADVATALSLAGVSLSCQWPTSLYNSAIAGCHRQVDLGIATIIFGTLRVVLTLLILREETHPS